MKTLEQIVESEKYIPMTYLDYQVTYGEECLVI